MNFRNYKKMTLHKNQTPSIAQRRDIEVAAIIRRSHEAWSQYRIEARRQGYADRAIMIEERRVRIERVDADMRRQARTVHPNRVQRVIPRVLEADFEEVEAAAVAVENPPQVIEIVDVTDAEVPLTLELRNIEDEEEERAASNQMERLDDHDYMYALMMRDNWAEFPGYTRLGATRQYMVEDAAWTVKDLNESAVVRLRAWVRVLNLCAQG